jgi:zinc protease
VLYRSLSVEVLMLVRARVVVVASLFAAACGAAPRSPSTPAPARATEPAPDATPPAETGPLMQPLTPSTDAIKVRSMGGIDEYVLANGMSVLLFPDPSQSSVTVNVTYLVGSRHEGYGETGMAHLLEHMLFKGTPTHRNVMKLLDEKGAFFNGSTWNDRTNYYETLPASADNLKFALELEADRMVNASILAEDLKSEFSVVRNELESGENDPVGILEERVTSTAFIWHNYGKSTIGSRSDVENVPVDRLRAFYEKFYQPDNAVLVVAGRFDVATTLDEIERTFGRIPRPARTLPPTYTVEPVQDGERTVVLRRVGDVHVLMAGYHGVAGADPDRAAFDALDFVFTDEPGGRLYKQLVSSGLAADVWSSMYLFHDPGMITFGVKVRSAKAVERVKKTLLAELENVAKKPITAAELERWRATTLKDITLMMSDSNRVAIELSEWAAAGDWRLMIAYREQVKALDVNTVNRVAVQYLVQSNRTLGEFVPTKSPVRAPMPGTPDIGATVERVAALQIEDGEAFAIDLDHLATRTRLKSLAGGIEAAFVPRKTRGKKVQVELVFHHGDEKSLTGKAAIAEMTADLAERGTRRLDHARLNDRLAELTADVSVGGGAGSVVVRITTVRESLPGVVDLVAEMLKTPAFDGKELEIVRRGAIADLEESLTEPESLGFNAFQRALSPWPAGHPRAVMTPEEEMAAVKKVTIAQVRAYHAAFWGAGSGEIAAVGDFDPEALAMQLEKHFGGWKAKTPYVRIPDKAFDVAAASKTIDTRDKEMAIVVGGHTIAVDDSHADAAPMALAAAIFGSSTGSRIWMRLREKEGFSYGAWGYAQPGARDPVGQVGFGAIMAPRNGEAARAALVEEMTRIVEGGVTAAEVATAKQQWLEQMDNFLASEDSLVGILRQDRELKRDWSWWKTRRAAVTALTDADVNRTIKTWFHPGKLVIILAGDQAKAKAQK